MPYRPYEIHYPKSPEMRYIQQNYRSNYYKQARKKVSKPHRSRMSSSAQISGLDMNTIGKIFKYGSAMMGFYRSVRNNGSGSLPFGQMLYGANPKNMSNFPFNQGFFGFPFHNMSNGKGQDYFPFGRSFFQGPIGNMFEMYNSGLGNFPFGMRSFKGFPFHSMLDENKQDTNNFPFFW